MPWLLQQLTNGKPPGAYSWVESDHVPADDEALVQNDPTGRVWDAAIATVRDRTAVEQSELQAAQLQVVKDKKIAELVAAADTAYEREIPSFAGIVVAAKFVPPANTQYLNVRELTIFNKIQAGYTRFNTLLDQVTAATTVEQVEAVLW